MRNKKYHQLVREAAINFNEIDYYNDLEINVEFNFWFQIITNNFKIVIEDNWFSGRIILINLNEIDYYNDLEINVEFNFWFQIISNNYKIVIEDNWYSGRIILINLETGNRTRLIDREPLKIIKKRIRNNNKLFK